MENRPEILDSVLDGSASDHKPDLTLQAKATIGDLAIGIFNRLSFIENNHLILNFLQKGCIDPEESIRE